MYVPAGIIEAYQAASPWKDFHEVIAISDDYVLVDKANHSIPSDVPFHSVTYTRNFPEATVGTWQAMYLPISIDVEAYKDDFDVAEIYAFSPYRDTNGDGVLDGDDENYLFVSVMRTGYTVPNVPYSIRPKRAGEITIQSANGILYAACAGEITLATSRNTITIQGLDRPKTIVSEDNNYYVAIDGTLSYTTSQTTIMPNRWILNMKSRGYGGSINAQPHHVKSIGILAVGEDVDEETALQLTREERDDSRIYTIDGKMVSPSSHLPAGLYIKNGKKYNVK